MSLEQKLEPAIHDGDFDRGERILRRMEKRAAERVRGLRRIRENLYFLKFLSMQRDVGDE